MLAALSDNELTTVSSAIYNGGFKKAKAILNVQVLEECDDRQIHENPKKFIADSAKKIGVSDNFVGMVTAAAVDKFALASKEEDDLAVTVTATAVDPEGSTCSHAESAGETINIAETSGTINIMVIIDGNPTESCMVSTVLTATEAKTAAMWELDIRSRYSGDIATGTVTDAIIAAKTGHGEPIVYGGPASKLGQLVGYCTRKAVKEALMEAKGCLSHRSVVTRLSERHLPLEKLASELAKFEGLTVDAETLAKILVNEPLFALVLMAAARMDEDIKNELVPSEFRDISVLSRDFGDLLSREARDAVKTRGTQAIKENCNMVNLPPFLKQVLINIVKSAVSWEKIEKLK